MLRGQGWGLPQLQIGMPRISPTTAEKIAAGKKVGVSFAPAENSYWLSSSTLSPLSLEQVPQTQRVGFPPLSALSPKGGFHMQGLLLLGSLRHRSGCIPPLHRLHNESNQTVPPQRNCRETAADGTAFLLSSYLWGNPRERERPLCGGICFSGRAKT